MVDKVDRLVIEATFLAPAVHQISPVLTSTMIIDTVETGAMIANTVETR